MRTRFPHRCRPAVDKRSIGKAGANRSEIGLREQVGNGEDHGGVVAATANFMTKGVYFTTPHGAPRGIGCRGDRWQS